MYEGSGNLAVGITYQFKLDTVAVLVERESGVKFYLHAPLPA
jgi:hypothetical protein